MTEVRKSATNFSASFGLNMNPVSVDYEAEWPQNRDVHWLLGQKDVSVRIGFSWLRTGCNGEKLKRFHFWETETIKRNYSSEARLSEFMQLICGL
jgi:hypothetical protein